MLDDVLAELEAERVRGGRDWRKKLVDDFHHSDAPLAWLKTFREAAGVKDIEPSSPDAGLGNMVGATFAGIFAGAAAQAAAQLKEAPAADDADTRLIDVNAVPISEQVQHKLGEGDKPIDW
jgi:hypothetical protein